MKKGIKSMLSICTKKEKYDIYIGDRKEEIALRTKGNI